MADNNKIKVLVVEDVALAAKMNKITLEDLNCDVTVATTGADAISKFKSYQFDLVFMDLGLPDLDGVSVCKKIRALKKFKKRIPIVALTAHTSEALRQHILENTCLDGFLSKPLTKDKAQDIIQRFVIT